MRGYPQRARVFDYLLAHGRYKISVYAAYGSHWAFCFVPTAQTELKAALHTRPRIGHDFNNLEYVSLYTEMSRVIMFQISEHTAPLTAKSSPRLIVVPTAMKSLCPDSVLKVSSDTHASEFTNSFDANSYLNPSS